MSHKKLLLSSIVILVLFSFPLISSVEASSEMWNQVYGGAGADFAHSLVETSDGGYAVAGCTSYFGAGGADFLLIKTDEYGTMEWNRTYGGIGGDFAYSLVETSDGGFALAGEQNNNFWLVKTDEYGNTEWNQTYGEAKYNHAYSVVEPADGGFVLASTNFQLIKTDAHGTVEWNWTYGREDYDTVYSLVETSDGGFALAGETCSVDDGNGFWLVKTNASGNVEWNQTYRRTEYDRPYSLIQTADGGYALAGETINLASTYVWVVKTNENGIIPEFPSWIILPLFLTATLIVTLARKRLMRN